MKQMINFSTIILLATLGFLNLALQNVYAADTNGDGLDDVFIYSAEEETVYSFSAEQGYVRSTPLGPNVQKGTLIPIILNNEAYVASLRQNGRLQIIQSDGSILNSVEVGDISNSYLFLYDIDKNGSFDILKLSRRGSGVVRLNPLSQSPTQRQVKVRAPRKSVLAFSYTSSGNAAVTAFKPTRNGRRQQLITTEILTGSVSRSRMAGKVVLQPESFPALLPESYVLSQNMSNGRTRLRIFVTGRRKPYQMTLEAGRAAIPGHFLPLSAPQIAVLGNGLLDILSVETREVLARYEVSDPSIFPGSGENCPEDTLINQLVNQAISAASSGNFLRLQQIIDQLFGMDLCQSQIEAVFDRLEPYLSQFYAYLPGSTSTAIFQGDAFLLGLPSYAAGIPEANGKNRAGCDSSRPINNGAVLKNGDHTGKVVFLTPAGTYPSNCSIVRPNGKLVERLQFTGIANGARSHWRGSRSQRGYPKKGVIRCEVDRGFDTQNLCWETNNFHVRNS